MWVIRFNNWADNNNSKSRSSYRNSQIRQAGIMISQMHVGRSSISSESSYIVDGKSIRISIRETQHAKDYWVSNPIIDYTMIYE